MKKREKKISKKLYTFWNCWSKAQETWNGYGNLLRNINPICPVGLNRQLDRQTKMWIMRAEGVRWGYPARLLNLLKKSVDVGLV